MEEKMPFVNNDNGNCKVKTDEFLSDDTKRYLGLDVEPQIPRTYLPISSVSPEANIRNVHRRYVKRVIKDIFKFLAICVASVFLMCAAILFIVLSAWMP